MEIKIYFDVNKSDIKNMLFFCRTVDFPAPNSRSRQTGTQAAGVGAGREVDLHAWLPPAPARVSCVHPAQSPESELSAQPEMLLLGPQFLSWNVSHSTRIY